MHERMATGEVEQDARAGIGTMDARQAWGALVAHATKWKEWSDGSDDRPEEGLVAVYLTAGRGLIPRRGDWLPGTPWDMSDLAPLSVAERCEPAPEDATFTHVCGYMSSPSRTFVGSNAHNLRQAQAQASYVAGSPVPLPQSIPSVLQDSSSICS